MKGTQLEAQARIIYITRIHEYYFIMISPMMNKNFSLVIILHKFKMFYPPIATANLCLSLHRWKILDLYTCNFGFPTKFYCHPSSISLCKYLLKQFPSVTIVLSVPLWVSLEDYWLKHGLDFWLWHYGKLFTSKVVSPRINFDQ